MFIEPLEDTGICYYGEYSELYEMGEDVVDEYITALDTGYYTVTDLLGE